MNFGGTSLVGSGWPGRSRAWATHAQAAHLHRNSGIFCLFFICLNSFLPLSTYPCRRPFGHDLEKSTCSSLHLIATGHSLLIKIYICIKKYSSNIQPIPVHPFNPCGNRGGASCTQAQRALILEEPRNSPDQYLPSFESCMVVEAGIKYYLLFFAVCVNALDYQQSRQQS